MHIGPYSIDFETIVTAFVSELPRLVCASAAAILTQLLNLQIPDPFTWMICMQIVDFAMGTALALKRHEWCPRKFWEGVMLKALAFVMLGGVDIMRRTLERSVGLQYDATMGFCYAVIAYEFLSAGNSYRKIGGPGAEWLNSFTEACTQRFRKIQHVDKLDERKDAA